ncbi:aminotransferase class V-fold PLP-dependent enzyme [Ferrimonas senticii]|uniref:aminotransferase class V-fold PLP-dependent enzyme n=1 Tax=Ferrimonas senticii TaxID=394566 RepID=UPI000418A728|nr:aminotransferase class V-fold PLP-dependent enzyme [Ferrimonas senticii]
MSRADFQLPNGHYLASHSAGRPLIRVGQVIAQRYLEPWAGNSAEPWAGWLAEIERFRQQLALLFAVDASGVCPQSNVSSGVAKVAMALPALQAGKPLLMSEHDFPSIGFALAKALPLGTEQIRFIPKHLDLTDANVWERYITDDLALVWVTHGFSNLGALAPLAEIAQLARTKGILTAVDVAQTAGVIPLNASALGIDMLFGSCLKWLCGGAGAGFMWLRPELNCQCQPKDVGWFSHQDPFAMDIHQFQYHDEALRFWGGTPSVAPFVIAADSIGYFNQLGIDRVRQHNLALQQQLLEQIGDLVVSPHQATQRSGTLIINVGAKQPRLLSALQAAGGMLDERHAGVRLSPHIYNDSDDIDAMIAAIQAVVTAGGRD